MPRLDQELLRRDLARSRTHAAALIAEGRVVLSGGTASKAAVRVGPDDEITVSTSGAEYVSRAGYKLEGALEAFDALRVAGRRCLDAGASTGGFTDVLLRRGASSVVAVDVGHDQLAAGLREDPRVQVYEGFNVRNLQPSDIGGTVALCVADLSFISLTLVMEALARSTEPGGDLVLMVKPQFEVGRARLSNTGVVTSDAERLRAVGIVLDSALNQGLGIVNLVPSTLSGQDGNLEFFLWTKVPNEESVPRIETEQNKTVAEWLDALAQKMAKGRWE
ncbi:TlyA family RNA methyltransferase [Arthrobacter castelli]|uniref:TlyA family RNA methyltransferase n=1 Tax=Arthrobacter castelli TaxID=271431 RepID=UPI0003F6D34B|nr:TlyA family RNA methyltransferase [Arthrobacter castelli]